MKTDNKTKRFRQLLVTQGRLLSDSEPSEFLLG